MRVTGVGVEPTKSRGSRPRRFASLRTRPCHAKRANRRDLTSNDQFQVFISSSASRHAPFVGGVGCQEADLSFVICASKCVGQESNLHCPKAGGLQPLGHANAQPTRSVSVARVGIEPTESRRFELRRFAGIAYRAIVQASHLTSVLEGI